MRKAAKEIESGVAKSREAKIISENGVTKAIIIVIVSAACQMKNINRKIEENISENNQRNNHRNISENNASAREIRRNGGVIMKSNNMASK